MTRIAIACEGGGSHTAFTAGALRAILSHDEYEIVAISGTSGGAVCALLTWYGLQTGGPEEAARLLSDFWAATAATSPLDAVTNAWLVWLARAEGNIALPVISPYTYPEIARAALTNLITGLVDFDEVARLQERAGPLLLIGAVDVGDGSFKAFSSDRGDITLNAVLASSALPPLFRAVHEGGRYYWDGLFSQNPPVRELPAARPEEIWVIRIDPLTREREPMTTSEIADRRNELSGNLSLQQELYFIGKVNDWVDRLGSPYRHIKLREMGLDARLELDAASKFDRTPALISALMLTGYRTAEGFLRAG